MVAKVSASMIWDYSKVSCGFAGSAAFLGVRGEGAYSVNHLPWMLSMDGIA